MDTLPFLVLAVVALIEGFLVESDVPERLLPRVMCRFPGPEDMLEGEVNFVWTNAILAARLFRENSCLDAHHTQCAVAHSQ